MAESGSGGADGSGSARVGSVAEEAAKLLDALMATDWAAATRRVDDLGDDDTADDDLDELDDLAGDALDDLDDLAGDGHDAPVAGERYDEAGQAPADGTHVCSACGHVEAGRRRLDIASETDPVCRVCPVCQLVRVARTVRPETMERLADFATALASSLREVAATSRASGSTRSAGGSRRTVQDIPLSDDDIDEPDDDGGHDDTQIDDIDDDGPSRGGAT